MSAPYYAELAPDESRVNGSIPSAVEMTDTNTPMQVMSVLVESSASTATATTYTYSDDSEDDKPKPAPKGTILYFLLILTSFVYGVIHSENSEDQLSLLVLSAPPENQRILYMTAISSYPNCEDLRYQIWRLVTNMLVHGGLLHFTANMVALAIFGTAYERLRGSSYGGFELWFVILNGVLFGNIAAFYADPFVSVVGCSGGMYAIMGALLSRVTLDPYLFKEHEKKMIFLFIFIQLIFDVMLIFLYPDTLSWTCHFGGFISGALLDICWSDRKSSHIGDNDDNEHTCCRSKIIYTIFRMLFRCAAISLFILTYMSYRAVEEPIAHITRPNHSVACCSSLYQNRYESGENYNTCYTR
jgi:membrane associated rhomboid family serine protease